MLTPAGRAARDLVLGTALLAASRPAAWRRPLNRDLAQYLYAGAEVRRGGVPYLDVALNKGPLTFVLFAGVGRLAGRRPVRVRLALLPAGAASVALLRATLGRLAPSPVAAAAAAATFALLGSAEAFEGDEPNTEVIATAPALAAAWGVARGDAAGAVVAGTALGLAVLVNPALACAAVPLAAGLDRRRGAAATAALAATLGASVEALRRRGAWDDFRHQVLAPLTLTAGDGWRQNTTYGRAREGAFLGDVPAPPLWAAGLAGCLVGLTAPETRRAAAGAGLWSVAAWARVKGVAYAYPHHYVPALPGLSAGLALGADAGARRLGLPAGPAAALAAAPFVAGLVALPQLRALRRPPWDRPPARPEDSLAHPAAERLRAVSEPGERVFVPGSEPAVLWLADRRAQSRFFDLFPLAHHAPYRAERAAALRARPPELVCAMPTASDADPGYAALLAAHDYDEVWAWAGMRILRRVGSAGRAPEPPIRPNPGRLIPLLRPHRRGRRAGRRVSLTFDDGPGDDTAPLLDALAAAGVRATFFISAGRVPGREALVGRVAGAGHEVASHGVRHRDMRGSPRAAGAELRLGQRLIAGAGAPPPRLFRPPFGFWDRGLVAAARALGLRTVLWDADPEDWRVEDTAQIRAAVPNLVAPGSIVLLHELPATVAAVPGIIGALRAAGYDLVPCSEVLAG